MLILKRKRNESITITVPPSDVSQVIVVTQCGVDARDDVRFGIEADRSIHISRDDAKKFPKTSFQQPTNLV